jgi:FAD synthetase
MRIIIVYLSILVALPLYTNDNTHIVEKMNCHTYIPTQNISLPKNKKLVLVGGCFDILHFGHIQFLENARHNGDYLIVALEPDERILHHKKRTPTHTQEERAYNLLALRAVDHIILLPLLSGFADYLELVKNINPHVIAVTSNDPQLGNKQKQADLLGAELVIVNDRIEHLSSSAIYKHHLD